METNPASKWSFLWILLIWGVQLAQCSVSYDNKALIINGQRRILFSGSIHYPRSTPQMWEGLVQKAKDGGLDAIDTYVFWNLHEPSSGNYNFEGRCDLVRFIKVVQKAGLYVHLRIGPYVCAEWNFGGFPVWLKYVPGISFRTDNEPFKTEMQRFTQKIVQMMEDEKLFKSQGGPIIMSQIENEYGPESKAFGGAGYAYMSWAAKMAVELGTGVPWVMCREDDAPDPVINTCNGFYCDYFSPNKPYKPTMWTEAWSGWFTEFGGPIHQRPVEDLAFAVARFIQKGGSFVNYYMYQGGTNFGRTAGGPFITTSYDYDAPLDEYGLIRQPKYGHLKELHSAIKLCERALVSADPTVTLLGSYSQAHVFSSKSGDCAAFLSNYHLDTTSRVTFRGVHYDLPPWSISILPDCKNVVFNTAKVGVQTSQMQMLPTNAELLSWETFSEDISSADEDSKITVVGLLEQLNVTRDTSDYLWYMTSVEISPSELFLHSGQHLTLTVQSAGDALHVFTDGQLFEIMDKLVKEGILSKSGTDSYTINKQKESAYKFNAVKEEMDVPDGKKAEQGMGEDHMYMKALYHALPMNYITATKLQDELEGEANKTTERKLIDKMTHDGFLDAKSNRRLGKRVIHSDLTEKKLMEVKKVLDIDAMDLDINESHNKSNHVEFQKIGINRDMSTCGMLHSIGSDLTSTRGGSETHQNGSLRSEQTGSRARDHGNAPTSRAEGDDASVNWSFSNTASKPSAVTLPLMCAMEYQNYPQSFRLPASSPYDNFLKAAGC